jgi:rubrerythrin
MGVRSTKRENMFRRARNGWPVTGFDRLGRNEEREPAERRFAVADRASVGSATARRELFDLDPIQDKALYNCTCGYVFEAEVKTAVSCPHCGAEQAW